MPLPRLLLRSRDDELPAGVPEAYRPPSRWRERNLPPGRARRRLLLRGVLIAGAVSLAHLGTHPAPSPPVPYFPPLPPTVSLPALPSFLPPGPPHRPGQALTAADLFSIGSSAVVDAGSRDDLGCDVLPRAAVPGCRAVVSGAGPLRSDAAAGTAGPEGTLVVAEFADAATAARRSALVATVDVGGAGRAATVTYQRFVLQSSGGLTGTERRAWVAETERRLATLR